MFELHSTLKGRWVERDQKRERKRERSKIHTFFTKQRIFLAMAKKIDINTLYFPFYYDPTYRQI